jgi:hypothetical protein
VPEKRINSKQVQIYMSVRERGCTQQTAAAKADISVRSGRRIEKEEQTVAAVDRLVHHASIIEIQAESFRKQAALQRSFYHDTISQNNRRRQQDNLLDI